MSLIKTLSVIVFSSFAALAASAAETSSADALNLTGSGATKTSLLRWVSDHGCKAEVAKDTMNVGACFGFPREVKSSFLFDSRGYLVESTLVVEKSQEVELLRFSLTTVHGKPVTNPGHTEESWQIGRELWTISDEKDKAVLVRTHDSPAWNAFVDEFLDVIAKL